MTLIAITRDVSTSLGECQLSFVARTALDVERARQQHRGYCDALHALGCRVIALAPQHDLPDAVFVEDTAVVLDELAVLTRPGAQARRDEVASVAAALAEWRPLAGIVSPGTLDGGDVLRIGRRLYVGASARSNAAGIAQLAALVEPHGYSVQAVATSGCLHLKSAVTALADDLVLIQPAWVDARVFVHVRQIDPALRISNLREWFPIRRAEHFATWADGLRKAGLPE